MSVELGVVSCAARPCPSRGRCLPSLDDRGQLVPAPPSGWGEIAALRDDGVELRLFVCSPACERRLIRGLATPALGEL